MTPWGAVGRVVRNSVRFSGRATRSEFWWWVLVLAIVLLIASAVQLALPFLYGREFIPSARGLLLVFLATGVAIWLVTFLPTTAVAVRRLHDTGRSGWWVLLWYAVPVPFWLAWVAAYLATLGQAFGGGDPSAVPFFVMLGLSLAANAAVTVWAVRWLAGR